MCDAADPAAIDASANRALAGVAANESTKLPGCQAASEPGQRQSGK